MCPDETFDEVMAFTKRLASTRSAKIRDHIHALECSDDALYLNKSKVCEIDALNVEIRRLGLLQKMINLWFTQ